MFKSNNVPDRMPGQHAFSQGLEQSERLEDKKKYLSMRTMLHV